MACAPLAALLLSLSLPALADGEGTAGISPGPEVLAGLQGTWEITYEPGAEGIRPGGGLRLPLSGFPIRLFARPQSDDPAGANYVTARCANRAVDVSCRAVSELRQGWMQVEEVQVIVGEPGLSVGESITVTYGDTSGGGPGGTVRGAEGDGLPIRLSSDTNGDGRYAPLAEFPRLTLIGGPAAKLAVCAPSEAIVGKPVLVSVSVRDQRNAVATQALPEVTLDGPTIAKPVTLTFTEGKRAVAQTEVTFRRPGVHRLTASAKLTTRDPIAVLPPNFLETTIPEADYDPEFRPEVTKVEISALEARQGSTMRVVSHWINRGNAAPNHTYRIMCHLQRRPAAGRALANWDHNVPIASADWTPGAEMTATRIGSIPASVPDGRHALVLGLYHQPEPGVWAKPVEYDICWVQVGPDEPLISDVSPGRSNPIDVLARPREHKLLWGDLHCHTENSGDGSGMVEALYNYARDTARLDFTACSDHVSHKYPADQWRQIQELAERFNDPGKFVSILGYEWSNGWHGDKNVYFTGDYEAIRVPESGEAEDLWPMLQGVDCIVIPHHPAYPVGLRGMDWGRIDKSLVPAVEMCSAHGLAEYLGNPRAYGKNKPMGPSLPGGFAQDALARGLRIGFICSSDDHSAHAGKSGFLAAVYADEFDRFGIINAIRDRRCYGSTGARILIDTRVNGRPMGEVVRCDSPPEISVRIHGTAKLQLVELVHNGDVCYATEPKGESCEFDYMATELVGEESYYYARVTQVDGEMAWASPTFVRNTGPLPRLDIADPTPGLTPEGDRFVSVAVANDGRAPSDPATIRLTLDGPVSTPVPRERMPAKSGIGGLMQTPGLQAWRWPVDETSINLFVRWGGAEGARDCEGEVRLLDYGEYYMTPFHVEADDEITDDGNGLIRWSTSAEPGAGDGVNIWVRIDPRRETRARIDATRAGERRPAEAYTHLGELDALPFDLPLVDYRPSRWIGEAPLPALAPGDERTLTVDWAVDDMPEGEFVCEVVP